MLHYNPRHASSSRLRLKRDGTRAETRFLLSLKRTSPFKWAGASVQSTTGSRSVRSSGSNAGYTTFRGSVRVLVTHSIRQYPLHFPSRASPCAIRFQKHSTKLIFRMSYCIITASGIVTLCKRQYSTPVESALKRRTVRPFTESDDTRF